MGRQKISGRKGWFAGGAGDGCSQRGICPRGPGHVELKQVGNFLQGPCIGTDRAETTEPATLRRVRGGVNRVRAPFDEERKQTALVILERKALPVKDFTVGALARTGSRPFKWNACLAQMRREFFKITRMRDPAHQPWFL